jgi:hypothetical protein
VIRSWLNIALIATVYAMALPLLWLGSRVDAWLALPIGIVFSYVLLTNYALIHEAAHDNLFPVPFSMIKVTHTVHHCCNRTDHEMFDLYYPDDNMFLKLCQWYGLLSGLFWPWIPIGAVVLAVVPQLLRMGPYRRARTTAVLFDDFAANGVGRVRIETALTIVFWCALFLLLDLSWMHVLIMYACFAFNWSTRQYVTHAFTERDVINGALNLRVSPAMSLILLKGNWDLVHHQKPWLPWTELQGHGNGAYSRVGFLQQYLRMWRGPVPASEPGPQRLKASPSPG